MKDEKRQRNERILGKRKKRKGEGKGGGGKGTG